MGRCGGWAERGGGGGDGGEEVEWGGRDRSEVGRWNEVEGRMRSEGAVRWRVEWTRKWSNARDGTWNETQGATRWKVE